MPYILWQHTQVYRNSNYSNSALLSRAGTKLWSPQVSEDGRAHPFKINLEAEPQVWTVKSYLTISICLLKLQIISLVVIKIL